jgi:hypothetical protein
MSSPYLPRPAVLTPQPSLATTRGPDQGASLPVARG